MRNWGDALQANLRHPGQLHATRNEFHGRRSQRADLEQLLGQQALLLEVVARKKMEVDAAIEAAIKQRGDKPLNRIPPMFATVYILGGHRALLKFFETNDRTRVDIYYGGVHKPDGDKHGHIVIRNGSIVSWLADGANGSDRIRIV